MRVGQAVRTPVHSRCPPPRDCPHSTRTYADAKIGIFSNSRTCALRLYLTTQHRCALVFRCFDDVMLNIFNVLLNEYRVRASHDTCKSYAKQKELYPFAQIHLCFFSHITEHCFRFLPFPGCWSCRLSLSREPNTINRTFV